MTNLQVINAFANGKSAKSSNHNLCSYGDKLYNYYTCLAQRLSDGTILVNTTKYSVSTSKIQTYIKYVLTKYNGVNNVPLGASDLTRYSK